MPSHITTNLAVSALALVLCAGGAVAEGPVAVPRSAFEELGVRAFEDAIGAIDAVGSQRREHTEIPATLDRAALRDQQVAWREAITSIYVDYESEEWRDQPERGLVADDQARFRQIVAMKDDKVLVRSGPAGRESLGVFAFDGTKLRLLEFDGSSGAVVTARIAGRHLASRMYFHAFGYLHESETSHWTHFVPTLFDRPEFEVRPRLERIDGTPCHVLTCGFETFWIDGSSGAILRRVRFRTDGPRSPYVGDYLRVNRRFREVGPDVRLPYETELHVFAGGETAAAEAGVEFVRRISVNQLELNGVDDEMFVVDFPPGALVADRDHRVLYAQPSNVADLDAAIANGRRIVDGNLSEEGADPRWPGPCPPIRCGPPRVPDAASESTASATASAPIERGAPGPAPVSWLPVLTCVLLVVAIAVAIVWRKGSSRSRPDYQ